MNSLKLRMEKILRILTETEPVTVLTLVHFNTSHQIILFQEVWRTWGQRGRFYWWDTFKRVHKFRFQIPKIKKAPLPPSGKAPPCPLRKDTRGRRHPLRPRPQFSKQSCVQIDHILRDVLWTLLRFPPGVWWYSEIVRYVQELNFGIDLWQV